MGYLILTPDPQGHSRSPRGTPRGQGHTKFFSPNQQMLLIDIVTHASVMTKMCSASSPAPRGALGGAQKGSGGHTMFSPNQQMLLIDVVTYASVMTKMCLASSRDPPGALGGPKRAWGVTPKLDQMKKLIVYW